MRKFNNEIHKAKKQFGQNFLVDTYLLETIIKSLDVTKEDYILEIGPGLGAMTEGIINNCKYFAAVEIDKDLLLHLKNKFPKINLFNQDILKFDLKELFYDVNKTNLNQIKLKIIGNLPYNISTELLFKFFDNLDYIESIHIMLQKEVVDRIIAKPNNKAYGKLSVMTQYFCDIEEIVTLPPNAFNPAPKVFSKFIKLIPHRKTLNSQKINLLNKITTLAFKTRRKVINNNLGNLLSIEDYENLNINPRLRAENLTLEDYINITEYIWQRTQ